MFTLLKSKAVIQKSFLNKSTQLLLEILILIITFDENSSENVDDMKTDSRWKKLG